MGKKWMTLREDWTFKRSAKLVAYRLVFNGLRGGLWIASSVVHTPFAAVKWSAWSVEKLAKGILKVSPSIQKWMLIAHEYIDESFSKPDLAIKKGLEEINALPWGGKFIDYNDSELRLIQEESQTSVQPIPIADITKDIASYDGSVLIACRSGAGKTTTISSAMSHVEDADIWVFDGKGSGWKGIEKNPDRYFLCNHPNLIPRAVEALTHLVTVVMKGRQDARLANGGSHPEKPRRIIIICDEFNNIVTFAEMAKLHDELCNLTALIINLGREDLVNWWGVAQTHLVGEIKLSTGVQKSLAFVCQARHGEVQSVEAALCDRHIVANADERKRLQRQLDNYIQTETDQSQPICFSTIGGKRLVRLPLLSAQKPTSNKLPPSFSQANGHVLKNGTGSTVNQGFQLVEVLQKENLDPQESPKNGGSATLEATTSSRWEDNWDARFYQVFESIQAGKSDYWIAVNIFDGLNSGSSYQRLQARLKGVREQMGGGQK